MKVALNNWMSAIDKTTKLNEIIMPGSHDAGLSVVKLRTVAVESYIQTQTQNILGQLNVGTRFFDLRIYNWTKNVGKNKAGLYTGHFLERLAGKGKADVGGYGQKLDEVLAQVIGFLQVKQNSQETVILKFSHMTATNAEAVEKEVRTKCEKYLFKYSSSKMIPLLEMEKLRGKIIAMFDKKNLSHKKASPTDGTHLFRAYKPPSKDKLKTNDDELILWGEYSNTRDHNKLKIDQDKKLKYRAGKWGTAGNVPHLYQLYWTLTGNWFIAGWIDIFRYTKKARGYFNKYGPITKNKVGTKDCPNIVVYDFVNKEQNKLIVERNSKVKIS